MRVDIVKRGLPLQEIVQRLSTGWVVVPRVAVSAPSVALPGQPNAPVGVEEVDVWLVPEPMMPQRIVALGLVQMAQQGGDIMTLNALAQAWLGRTIGELEQMLAPCPAEADVGLEQPPEISD